ncbi:McrB family protein [Natronobacterium texcoconense]|uniref:5-methylcytosine-specific restriction enzyme B n=1 Tax=Natronobacterium texcoconense TaxID=1095778 RepID=A0A1H1FYG1_NATTX|nr:AAA family ATPase [Natronobacterium texcoconense]SDR06034.1 5-methylcytosine-specific restriction enzyme B [Natronobacterium texcoconense]
MAPGIVLASATSPTEQAVFDELVYQGVERARLSSYRPPGNDQIVHSWPLPLADHVDTSGLTAGDYVLFYRGRNRYSWAAKVKTVENDTNEIGDVLTGLVSNQGSEKIKPSDEFSDAVLFLDIPVPIELESYRLHDLLGIDQEALTRTVIPNDDAVKNLRDEFGSLEEMIRTTRETPSVFIEVTSVNDKPYKKPNGEFPLGSAVFSRSEDSDGRQIYETLRDPEVGDLVLHVRKDSRELAGVSTVASTLQEDFEGPPDDSWPQEVRGEGYFRPLGNYDPFDDPPDIDQDLLQNADYRDRLQRIYDSTENLFYDRNFELAHGAYFTESPLEFLYLCIAEQPALVDLAEERYWSIPQPDAVERYDTVTDAVVDVRTKLPFDERDRNWFLDAFTEVVVQGFTDTLSMVEPDAVLTEREAAYISMIKDVYESRADEFEQAADRLGIGRTKQVSPSETLFFVLFRGLQSHVGLSPNMDQVKTKVIINDEYDVEIPTPKFDPDDKTEPLTDRPMPDRGEDIARQLIDVGQMVFYGPPGTGKTYTAEQFARWWLNQQPHVDPTTGQLETVTFHPSFTYEDFIEGLSVDTTEEGQVRYDEQPGVFLEFAERARQAYYASEDSEPAPRYVMIIDEINRGNLAQIFGEMITALEVDKRLDGKNEVAISLAHSGNSFSIPPNLYLIGTMNTADRSIALVDAALRRRFRFLSFPPNLDNGREANGFDSWGAVEDAARTTGDNRLIAQSLIAVKMLNDRIRDQPDLGRGKQIGHSFFYGLSDNQDVVDMWRFEILPLLEEYFFGQYERIRDALFSGNGEQLFDWKHQQIKAFDAAALESELGSFVREYVEDTEAE